MPLPNTFAKEKESVSQRFHKGWEIIHKPVLFLELVILQVQNSTSTGISTDWQSHWIIQPAHPGIIHTDTLRRRWGRVHTISEVKSRPGHPGNLSRGLWS